MRVISCKAFLFYGDVMTIKDEVIFHQSEIAPDRATTWHWVELSVFFIRHGCTSLFAVATSGSDLLPIRRDWTELRGSGEEEVAQKFSHGGQTFYYIVPRQHHEKFADVPDVKPFSCGFGCSLENAFVSRGGQRKPKTSSSLLFFFWTLINLSDTQTL